MDAVMLFVSAVMAHWLFTFGGIAMVAFGLYEKLNEKDTEKWIFWGLAVVLLLVAFYQAWSDEHRNTQAVIQERQAAIIAQNRAEALNGEKDRELAGKDHELAYKQEEIEYLRSHQSIQIAEPKHTGHTHFLIPIPSPLVDNPYWPLRVGQQIELNVQYLNVGDILAHEYGKLVRIDWDDVPLGSATPDSFNHLLTEPLISTDVDINPHSVPRYKTYFGPTVTQSDIDGIVLSRSKMLCASTRIRWQDESGCYETRLCTCLAAEAGPPGFNWHTYVDKEEKVSCGHT